MGTSADDIRHVLRTAGLSPRRRDGLASRSGYYTALSVFAASRAGARHAGLALAGAPVAIEGFGSVGGALARLLADAGARVVAISTRKGAIYDARGLDVARASALAREAGSGVVDLYGGVSRLDCAELIELPVVALFPCARHHSVRADNASAVRAQMVCPGANDPVTADAERLLTGRGVLCVPDFVANAGGVLGGTLAFASVGDAAIAGFIEHRFGPRVAWLLEEAAHRACPAATSRWSAPSRGTPRSAGAPRPPCRAPPCPARSRSIGADGSPAARRPRPPSATSTARWPGRGQGAVTRARAGALR